MAASSGSRDWWSTFAKLKKRSQKHKREMQKNDDSNDDYDDDNDDDDEDNDDDDDEDNDDEDDNDDLTNLMRETGLASLLRSSSPKCIARLRIAITTFIVIIIEMITMGMMMLTEKMGMMMMYLRHSMLSKASPFILQ